MTSRNAGTTDAATPKSAAPEDRRSIDFGWGRDPLGEQLAAMGFNFNADTVAHLERDIDAGLRLHMRHRITDSAWRDCVRKVTKAVEVELRRAAKAPPSSGSTSVAAQVEQPIREVK